MLADTCQHLAEFGQHQPTCCPSRQIWVKSGPSLGFRSNFSTSGPATRLNSGGARLSPQRYPQFLPTPRRPAAELWHTGVIAASCSWHPERSGQISKSAVRPPLQDTRWSPQQCQPSALPSQASSTHCAAPSRSSHAWSCDGPTVAHPENTKTMHLGINSVKPTPPQGHSGGDHILEHCAKVALRRGQLLGVCCKTFSTKTSWKKFRVTSTRRPAEFDHIWPSSAHRA